MRYKHLTAAVRGAIEALLHENYTQESIAGKLGVSKSTVSREISKRGTPSGYFARVAQEHYERVRRNCRQRKKCLLSFPISAVFYQEGV